MDDPHGKAEAAVLYPHEQTERAWREAVLEELRDIHLLLAHLCVLAERPASPEEKEPAAGPMEPPEEQELGTWILTDERVQAIEDAIEVEQRVRGRVYGG